MNRVLLALQSAPYFGAELLRSLERPQQRAGVQEQSHGSTNSSADRLQSLEMWNFTLPASVPSFRFPAGRGGGENKATGFLLRP